MTNLLKYERRVEVDRSRDCVLLQREPQAGDSCRLKAIFPEPSKRFLMPTDEERVIGVDAAYDYLVIKHEDDLEAEENVRRAIFAVALYMGMCAMATLFWALGYFKGV